MKKLLILISFSISLLIIGFNSADKTVAATDEIRDPNAGIYGIWYGNNEAVLSSEYLKGGQVILQWRDCETEEGKYNFNPLEKKLKNLAQRGLKAVVQINGNQKPDYLFKRNPYLPFKTEQVKDNLGSLMYWHPNHTKSYLDFISAYANYLKTSPYKNIIAGVRQNWNAFGTEHTRFPGIEDIKETDWIIPSGVEYYKFEPTTEIEYKRKIMTQFLDAFTPEITVFIRTNISDGLVTEYEDYFINGLAGWFHTGAGMEENQRFNQEHRYARFLKYCKTGMTVGFAESNAHIYDNRSPDLPFSNKQWYYWRVLSELHNGITYIGMRPYGFDKLEKGEAGFQEILEFVTRYVGYHAKPSISPGAWIALRGKGDNFEGDYTFLMNSLDNSALTDMRLVGDRNIPYGAWAQRLSSGGKIYLNINDAFYAGKNAGKAVTATIRIVYFDSGEGNWTINYDSMDDPNKMALQVTNGDSKKWKTIEIPINDGLFSNRCMTKADIVIENVDAEDCILHMVEVERGIVNEGGDIKAPSTPSNLKIENVTKYTCELKWDASIDAVGVTGYLVYRNNELITTVTSTNTSILNLNCGTSCNFSVKATDAAGNISESSNTVIAETLACPDSITSYQLVYDEDFEDNLAQDWLASPEDKWSISEGKYKTVKGGSFNSIYEGRQFQNYKLLAEANPSYGNNYGIIFNYIDANNYYMLELDASPTTVELVKFENGSKSIVASSTYNEGGLNFNNSIEIVHAFSKVTITVNGIEIFNDIDITSADSSKIGLYVFYNPVSFDNIQVYESTTGADTTAPSIPTEITASGITETSLDLSWAASTDSSGVAGYNIYKNGVLEKTVTGNETSITGLACGSTYPFTIVAVDVNGNSPDASEPVSFSTSPCSDIVDPDGPTALSVTGIGAYSLELNWTASTDNVGVRAYQVYIDNEFETAFFTTSATLYGLTCETDYTISIRAEDFSGNLSEAAEIEVSTADCTDDVPPLAPANLRAYNTTQTSTELTWLISSDNYGVTSYEVYLDDRHHTSVTTTWTEITGLKCDSTYQFTVKAKDAAGNLSEAGDTIEVVTGECIVNSIGNNFSLQNVSIYPVPFKHELTVRFDGVVGNCRIKVYDMPGSIVYAEHFYSAGNNLLKVGQNLAEGFYLIKIETDDSAITHRIIKKNNN